MRSTWMIETMVLAELKAEQWHDCITCQTVNRLAHKKLTVQCTFESCGAKTTKGGINLYIKLQKDKLDQIATSLNIRISLD